MVKLVDIAVIRAGYSFREGLSKVASGDLPVVQFKDIERASVDDLSTCVHISSEKIKSSHFLKFKDVLFSNRGNYKSAVFNVKFPCIASGVFFVMSVKNKRFLPEYVAAFLNSSDGQNALMSRQNASGVQAIIKSELEQIDIPLISIDKQKKIVELAALFQQEAAIIGKIQQKKKKLIDFIIKKELKE